MTTTLVHKTLNDTRKSDLLSTVNALGKEEGNGLNAKPAYARAVLDASINGVIASEDATALWEKFATAANNAKGDEHLRIRNPKTDKVRVSETKQFIMVGAMVQVGPMNLFERCLELIHNNDVTGSTYQNLVKLMREQFKKENSHAGLTDEQIIAIICPSPAEKEEKAILEGWIKAMRKFCEGTKGDPEKGILPKEGRPSPQVLEAISQLEDRLLTFTRAATLEKMIKASAELTPEQRVQVATLIQQH
jgi:hypothetical protein